MEPVPRVALTGSCMLLSHQFIPVLFFQLLVSLQDLLAIRTEIQCTITPFINKYHKQQENKYHHAGITCPSEFPESYGPREDENGFEIKDHEQHGNEIKLGGEAQSGGACTQDTPFVGLTGCTLLVVLPQKPGQYKNGGNEAKHNGTIGKQRP